MNHTDAVKEIVKIIPETQEEFKDSYKTNSPFMVIGVFTRQIKRLIKDQNQKMLVKSLKKMNQLYKNGDQRLKNAIETIFIYSLDGLTFYCDPGYKKVIFDKISVDIRQSYLHQVYKSGI